MERNWPTNLDFYPISNFALAVPLVLTLSSILLIFYKIYDKLTETDVKSSHQSSQQNSAKVLKYQRTAVLPSRRVPKKTSHNAKPKLTSMSPVKQTRKGMKRTATKTVAKKQSGKLSNASPVLSRRKGTSSNLSPKVSQQYS